MHPPFTQTETRLRRAEEWLAAGDARPHARKPAMTWFKRGLTGTAHECSAGASDEITIRLSSPEDRVAIQRLAELDGRRPPSGESILAIVGGELRAALPLGGGDAIADPFRPRTELVELLRIRNAALHDTGTRGRRPFRARIAAARR